MFAKDFLGGHYQAISTSQRTEMKRSDFLFFLCVLSRKGEAERQDLNGFSGR